MTTRRTLLRGLGAGVLSAAAWPGREQQPTKIPRIGVLWFASSSDPWPRRHIALFRQRLRELGYLEDKNILIDERYAEGDAQRLKELARELVDAKVNVIVASAVAGTIAARKVTGTIPDRHAARGQPDRRRTDRQPGAARRQCHRNHESNITCWLPSTSTRS